RLVGDRIAEHANLPAELGPLVADPAVHLERAGLRRPVDRAALEHAVAADAVGRDALVGDRMAEERAAATERAILLVDLADRGRAAVAARAFAAAVSARDAALAVRAGVGRQRLAVDHDVLAGAVLQLLVVQVRPAARAGAA